MCMLECICAAVVLKNAEDHHGIEDNNDVLADLNSCGNQPMASHRDEDEEEVREVMCAFCSQHTEKGHNIPTSLLPA